MSTYSNQTGVNILLLGYEKCSYFILGMFDIYFRRAVMNVAVSRERLGVGTENEFITSCFTTLIKSVQVNLSSYAFLMIDAKSIV